MLNRVELNDADQLKMAGVVSAQFADAAKELAAQGDLSLLNVTKDVNASELMLYREKYPRTDEEQADYDRQLESINMAMQILSFKGLKYLEKPKFLPKRMVSENQ